MNAIDKLKESIKSEITDKLRDYVDADTLNLEIIDALAHRCAVAETKLKVDRDLNEEKIHWKG